MRSDETEIKTRQALSTASSSLIGADTNRAGAGPRACPVAAEGPDGRPRGTAPTGTNPGDQPQGVVSTNSSQDSNGSMKITLADLVHHFKSLTTSRYWRKAIGDDGKALTGRLWQRNYFEHVIRNDDGLQRVRQYIVENPLKWELDGENPLARNAESIEPWES